MAKSRNHLKIHNHSEETGININAKKSIYMIISREEEHANESGIPIDDENMERV